MKADDMKLTKSCFACDLSKSDSFRDRGMEFAENTGMNGLPNAVRARNIFRRSFWIAIVIAGWGMTVWQVSELVTKYYSYPVNTDLTLIYNYSMQFPAVSFCNINPIRLSSVYLDQNISSLLKDTSPPSSSQPANVTTWDDKIGAGYYMEKNEMVSTEQNFLSYFAAADASVRERMGHNITWMLLDCTFGDFRCSPGNFTYFSNAKHGNCYTFNAGKQTEIRTTKKTGPTYGLTLELYIEHGEYIADLSPDAGIKLVIHNQSYMPFPEDDGFVVAPGTKTAIGLTLVDLKRAQPPYGNCQVYTSATNHLVNMWADEPGLDIGYSDRACFKTCFQNNVISRCGCCYAYYPCSAQDSLKDSINSIGGVVAPCNESNTNTSQCIERVTLLYTNNDLGCSEICKTSCDEVVYNAEISSSLWPSNPFMDSVYDKISKKDWGLWQAFKGYTNAAKKQFVRENVLKVEVYYKKLNFETIAQQPSYVLSNLLADIGGQLGLYLGLSVVTLFEFIELFGDVVTIFMLKVRRGSEKTHKIATTIDKESTF
ncbi:amiloride-sensitive sodium channel subunit gamma-like isoform X2 [Gigantopelta aegis]|uniref:amiloride-sensitive sodium channel subunit gamma-like isoform X2 n=1 Tax=Gigantopelta aegis TaxID=1735272 RepID=UPI001B8875D2|nr:amiloride-sensitive sodium channel subunit gamma-like isoform X2 [Gigantopelta aegis]